MPGQSKEIDRLIEIAKAQARKQLAKELISRARITVMDPDSKKVKAVSLHTLIHFRDQEYVKLQQIKKEEQL